MTSAAAMPLTDDELERVRRFWVDEDAGELGRDVLAVIEECQTRRVGEPVRAHGDELDEDEALFALAGACSDRPHAARGACREFAALRRAGWTIEWTLSDEGFVIVSTKKKTTEGDIR